MGESTTTASSKAAGRAAEARRLSLMLIGLGLLLSLGAMVLLVLRLLPTGVPGQWEWPWRTLDFRCPPGTLLVLPVCALPLLALLALLQRPAVSRRAAAGLVALCCLAGVATMLLLEAEEPVPPMHVAATTASLPATGYFGFATAVADVGQVFAALSGRPGQPAMPPRVQTHPPGPVLFYFVGLRALDQIPELTVAVEDWLARRYAITPERFQALSRWTALPSVQAYHFAAAVILGLTLTLLGALLPVPTYFVVAALHGRRAGLIGALAAGLVPSVAVFIPSIDGVAAVLALMAVALWLRALSRASLWGYALAGLGLAAAVFWSFGVLAVAVAMAAAAIPALRSPETRRHTLAGFLAAAGAVVVVFVLLYAVGAYNVLGNVRLMVNWQTIDIAHSQRDYLAWLTGNLYDTMLFMGPALLLAAGAVLPLLGRLTPSARHYVVGAFVALLLVWLSGSTLGEVGRIWLFLMALLVPGAACALAELDWRTARVLLVLLTLSQAGLIVLLHCRLVLVHP